MKTGNRTIRVDPDLWDLAGSVAAARGLTRADVIKAFLRWYVGELDAQLPTPAKRTGGGLDE